MRKETIFLFRFWPPHASENTNFLIFFDTTHTDEFGNFECYLTAATFSFCLLSNKHNTRVVPSVVHTKVIHPNLPTVRHDRRFLQVKLKTKMLTITFRASNVAALSLSRTFSAFFLCSSNFAVMMLHWSGARFCGNFTVTGSNRNWWFWWQNFIPHPRITLVWYVIPLVTVPKNYEKYKRIYCV